MFLTRITSIAIILACLFSACKKDGLPDNSNKRLKRIVSALDSIDATFYYDAQNRLAAITDSVNGHLWKRSIQYDLQDNPVKVKILYRDNPDGLFKKSADSLVYENGRLVERLHKPAASLPYKISNIYSYDTHGRLMADSFFLYRSSVLYNYAQFSYDANDNVVKWQGFINESGDLRAYGEISALYNTDKSLLYKNLGSSGYFLYNDWPISAFLLLSKNHVTQLTHDYGIQRNHTYEYDSEGFITRINVSMNGTGWSLVGDTNFYYE